MSNNISEEDSLYNRIFNSLKKTLSNLIGIEKELKKLNKSNEILNEQVLELTKMVIRQDAIIDQHEKRFSDHKQYIREIIGPMLQHELEQFISPVETSSSIEKNVKRLTGK